MKKARLLIVDDHEIFRRGLRALLEPSSEWQVCGEAVDGMDAIEKCKDLQPDVVVLDVTMPRLNGLEAARLIVKQKPEPQIVIITQHDSPQIRSAALEAGARTFITKSTVGSELITALRNLLRDRNIESAPPSTPACAPEFQVAIRTRITPKTARMLIALPLLTTLFIAEPQRTEYVQQGL